MLPLAALPAHAIPLNDDTVSPGLLGFGVFVVLLVALVFLVRSMNRHIAKIKLPREADLKQQEWEAREAARAAAEEKSAS